VARVWCGVEVDEEERKRERKNGERKSRVKLVFWGSGGIGYTGILEMWMGMGAESSGRAVAVAKCVYPNFTNV